MRPQLTEDLRQNGFLVNLYEEKPEISSKNHTLAFPYTTMQENLKKLGIENLSTLHEGVGKTIAYIKQWFNQEKTPISYSLVKEILCENLGIKTDTLDCFQGNVPVLHYVNQQLAKHFSYDRTMGPVYLKNKEKRIKN